MLAPTALSSKKVSMKENTLDRTGVTLFILGATLAAVSMLGERAAAQPKRGQGPLAAHQVSITIDYPLDGSISLPKSSRRH